MRGTTSRAGSSRGRHAQPKRRADGTAAILPALTTSLTTSLASLRGGETGPAGRRRAQSGSQPGARAGGSSGSHRAPRRAASREPVGQLTAEGSVPWARTVAFSGVTGVAALTVGFTVLADTDSASGFAPQARPQETATVTRIEHTAAPKQLPVARRSAPAEYVGKHVARPAVDSAPDAAENADTPAPAPVAAPSARPSSAPTPATPGETEAPETPRPPAPTEEKTPAPEDSPTPGLLGGLTGTLDDTVTGVVGVLPGLGG